MDFNNGRSAKTMTVLYSAAQDKGMDKGVEMKSSPIWTKCPREPTFDVGAKKVVVRPGISPALFSRKSIFAHQRANIMVTSYNGLMGSVPRDLESTCQTLEGR